MSSSDLIHRFLFDHTDIRGEITTLSHSCREVMTNNRQLPADVQRLLGELLAAVTLLSGTLKFDGILTLQAQGDGPLSLIMAECSHHREVRGVARLREESTLGCEGMDLQQLLGNGLLAIIIDPDKGQRYQGIVPLEAAGLAGCLESYFSRSEQLPTRFWLASDAASCAGLMLQALPQQVASADENRAHWETAVQLADTVRADELLQLDHSEVLYRLFNEEQVRLFEPAAVHFNCRCSRDRSAQALVALGREEVEALLAEQDIITIDCQFCNRSYVFGGGDLEPLFGSDRQHLH